MSEDKNNNFSEGHVFGLGLVLISSQIYLFNYLKNDWFLILFSLITVLILFLHVFMASILYVAAKNLTMSELEKTSMIKILDDLKNKNIYIDVVIYAILFAMPAATQNWNIAMAWGAIFILKSIMWLPIQKRIQDEVEDK